MAKKKKLLLFLVEGVTDDISLSTVLNRIIGSDVVKFHILNGDLFGDDTATTSNIVSRINERIQEFSQGIYRSSDFIEIIHLIDTDGCFVSEFNVIETDVPKIHYTEFEIQTKNRDYILERNTRKSALINKMISVPVVNKIPYSVYFFSSNLEHTLHNKMNQSREEKLYLARGFDRYYGEQPDEFQRLICESDFAVNTTYQDSWSFIKADNRSLQRYSNLCVYLQRIQ